MTYDLAFGCKLDAPDARGNWDATDRLRAAGAVPDRIDWTQHLDFIRNQNPTQACPAFSYGRAIQLAKRVQDDPRFEHPSVLQIYDVARGVQGRVWIDLATHEQMDDGASLGAVAEGLARAGFCPESACPWDVARVHYPLDVSEYLAAIDVRTVISHRILSGGPNRVQEIMAAMSLGHGVVIGIDVDQSFKQLSRSHVWSGMCGARLGGHGVAAVGYDQVSLWIVNSWGETWGDSGLGRIAWGYIASQNTRSTWVVDAVPDYLQRPLH